MKEELRIDIVGLAGACSYALDCIEAELVKIKNKHGKRVAYISVCMAEYLAIQGDALQDLAMCALLHDNALTQYITEELERNYVIDIKKDLSVRKTNLHCIYGEKNITKLPFKTDVSNVILYHHEHADGTGPFQKKWNETPLPARIIHLADTVDIIGNSIKSDDNRWDFICQYLSQKKDSLFDSECVNAFLHVFTKESFMCLSDDSFETKLWEIIPREKMVFDWEMCKDVADIPENPVQIFYYRQSIRGLFVKQYSISKLLLQFLLQVQVLPTAALRSACFRSHRMQIHTEDSGTDALAEYTLLLHEFLRSPYPHLPVPAFWL